MASNLKLENFSDRELLHILDDLAGDEGWVDVEVMASRVGLSKNGLSEEQYAIHARRCLSGRLGWIAQLSGTVERKDARGKERESPRWRLTAFGQHIVSGTALSESMRNRLEDGLSRAQALAAISALSRRYLHADTGVANLLRREWTYGTHRKRRG